MFLHCKLLRHSFCNTASSPNRVTPWLFIGLGNLVEKYQSTKHDVGFDMIDAFAQAQDIPMAFIHFKALFGEGMVGDTPVLLANPQTYMNLSGESKIIHNAWKTITEMCDSITFKRIKLQRLTQHLKLFSILKGQMASLEELLILKRDHSNSLSGATEALNANTLRLPIVSGAKADILEVKDAVASAVDMMQAMGSSICSLLSKVEGVSSFASEITKLVLQEQALLARSRNLLTSDYPCNSACKAMQYPRASFTTKTNSKREIKHRDYSFTNFVIANKTANSSFYIRSIVKVIKCEEMFA